MTDHTCGSSLGLDSPLLIPYDLNAFDQLVLIDVRTMAALPEL